MYVNIRTCVCEYTCLYLQTYTRTYVPLRGEIVITASIEGGVKSSDFFVPEIGDFSFFGLPLSFVLLLDDPLASEKSADL